MEADTSIDRVAELAARLERELATVIVGQQRVVREILVVDRVVHPVRVAPPAGDDAPDLVSSADVFRPRP